MLQPQERLHLLQDPPRLVHQVLGVQEQELLPGEDLDPVGEVGGVAAASHVLRLGVDGGTLKICMLGKINVLTFFDRPIPTLT